MLSKILNVLKNSEAWQDIRTTLFTCATSKEANILKGVALVSAIIIIFISMFVPDEHFWPAIYHLVSIAVVVMALMKVFARGDEDGSGKYAFFLVIMVGSTLFFGWSGIGYSLLVVLLLFTLFKCGEYYFGPAENVIGKNKADNYAGWSIVPSLVAGCVTWFFKDFVVAAIVTSAMVVALAYALQYLYMDARQLEKLKEQRAKLKQEKLNKAESA